MGGSPRDAPIPITAAVSAHDRSLKIFEKSINFFIYRLKEDCLTVEKLNCPNCGAPLPALRSGQTVSLCVYCSTALRIMPAADTQLAVMRAPEMTPDIITEVKDLLIAGVSTNRPVALICQRAGLSPAEARSVIRVLRKSIPYRPPLNQVGLLLLSVLIAISVGGVVFGAKLLLAGSWVDGGSIFLMALIFAGLNWSSMGESLMTTLLIQFGNPARATVLKSWEIKSVTASNDAGKLVRLLLDVHPETGEAFQAETNCMVSLPALRKFQPGSNLNVRTHPRFGKRVIVFGPAADEE